MMQAGMGMGRKKKEGRGTTDRNVIRDGIEKVVRNKDTRNGEKTETKQEWE